MAFFRDLIQALRALGTDDFSVTDFNNYFCICPTNEWITSRSLR